MKKIVSVNLKKINLKKVTLSINSLSVNLLRVGLIALLVCSISSFVFAEGNDNDFQQLLAKVQVILNKNVEYFTKEDLSTLTNVIHLSPNAFGESNSRLCVNLINQAKNKKREYDDFIDTKKNLAQTIDDLDRESELRMQAEGREEELLIENADLKTLIETLKVKIVNFEKQMNKLRHANKKLQAENMASKELLQTSSDLVAQMLMLMPRTPLDNATMAELPQTLKDSLINAQCGVAQMLKSNFLITIHQLEANQQFMDSAVAFFQLNRKHSPDITIYIDNGNELIKRLRSSGIHCSIGYAADIENEMNGFLMKIESQNLSSSGSSLVDFIIDNIIWLIPLLVILILGIVLVVKKTSSSNKQQ